MIEKISFTGLKGASTPENKKNLTMLSQKHGEAFTALMSDTFSKIDKTSGDKDVFVKTVNNDNHISIAIVDNKDNKIAKTNIYYKDYPSSSYCPLDSMKDLAVSFTDKLLNGGNSSKTDNSSLENIFHTYA